LFGLSAEQVTFPRPTGVGSLLDGAESNVVWDILQRGHSAS
jgi:hypothetical protein